MGSEDPNPGSFRSMVDRCSELEVSQASFRFQLGELTQAHHSRLKLDEPTSTSSASSSSAGLLHIPGNFKTHGPFGHVLHSMGRAVHVIGAGSGEIIYWNHAAEKLYGWKDHEVMGRCYGDFLMEEKFTPFINKIMEKLHFGHSWSGQFPLKKKCGEIFVAIVTKSPLYEDGEFVGVITVSSDAAVCNNGDSNQPRLSEINVKGNQCQEKPQIAPVPQMASSVLDLAPKVLPYRHNQNTSKEDMPTNPVVQDIDMTKGGSDQKTCQKEEWAAMLLAKLQIKNTGFNSEASDGNGCVVQNGLPVNDKVAGNEKGSTTEREIDGAGEQVGARNSSSGESFGSCNGSQSSKVESESVSMVDSDISWENLQFGVEIGQGSYAIVFHGLWNGSDVAIKLYFGKDYNEGALLDYKQEIGIMKKMRHPNVLLFMGACYSKEHLAIVTEFLPRGSLFKILHNTNQALDIRRRLRMALDVARGMNYLHRRNPPIVHRDLKSSNLLVDKNWNVKVGDFGLSKLKHATFVTAKSGGGTAQWMAPEVLRNEPSNEKSDVYSFGVILWELLTLSIPWDTLNSSQVVGVVGFMDRRLDIPEGLDPRLSSIITDCWQSKLELRPSFGDIIQRMKVILQDTSVAAAAPPVPKRTIT